MSKSRGNFLDPNDFVAAFGADGARYVVLREVPFDRDAEVSWDSFVRRYNADLANDFGNLVNRTVSMTNRYLDGERPAPRPAGGVAAGRRAGRTTLRRYRERLEAACCTTRWPSCGSSSAAPTRSWTPSSRGSSPRPAKAGDDDGRRRACAASSATSSRPAGSSASPPRRSCRARRRGCSAQLGHAYPYGPDGNGGPPILDELAWGAHASEAGRVDGARAAVPAPRRRGAAPTRIVAS